jgi:quercetin dioxygenase-like cupin family protein
MKMPDFPFSTTDWSQIPVTEHPGESGKALWRTQEIGDIRVRLVEYSPGYEANHWCSKGHVLLCLDGELETRLADGQSFMLKPGMSYHVGDGDPPHRSSTKFGAKLFIVD